MLADLSSGHKIGLAGFAAVFVLFALASSFVLPRLRPSYPGRGLPYFVFGSIVLFLGMMTAVVVFGRESEEARAKEEVETGPAHGGEASSTAPPTTNAGVSLQPLKVTETEWKVELAQNTLRPGSYDIELKNAGKVPHNLVVAGPQVNNATTPVIAGGKTAKLRVALVKGEYELYCSVPGHKGLGMDLKIRVS